MTKYIDLLREHQNSEGKADKQPAKDAATPATEDTEQLQTQQLEAMLPNEADADNEADRATMNEVPHNELLAEEETGDYTGSATVLEATHNSAAGNSEISDWLHHCIQEIKRLFHAASSDTPADIQHLTAQLNDFLKRMPDNPKLVDTLELEILGGGKLAGESENDLDSLVQKSVMMMLYALKVGTRLKLNTDELRSHTLAAMLHHIGMAQISGEIRNKKETLTEDELNEIRGASKKSHNYLSRCGITDAAILQAASQAQERFDGSGPQELSGTDIAYSARMVGLLSIFEALIHYRPHRHRLLPRDAIRELVNHHKKAFDPIMLKALIESISLYPVGTYVQLNSGDVGLVVKVHFRHPLRPVVQIMLNSHGDVITNRVVDLKYQPNLMVQRCMYEEGLSELKQSATHGA